MPTIKDVAARAGVSVATVSRTLNGVSSVDPELAKQVRSAARTLGYRTNGVARSLRRRQTDVWALIISDVANPFFTAIARGVEDVAQGAGYSVVLCNSDEDADKEARYLEVAERSLVAGVVLSPTVSDSDIGRLRALGIPVVAVDRTLSDPVDSVLVDSVTAARQATEHLFECGWSRPACITGPPEATTAQLRMQGFLEALNRRRVRRPKSLVRHTSYRSEGGREAASVLLDSDDPPDALFVANSELALGVMQELAARGLGLGRDLGMVAFDDAPWAPFIAAPLTVVAQPAYEVGVEAARLLLDRIGAIRAPTVGRSSVAAPPRTVWLGTRLVVRASSLRTG